MRQGALRAIVVGGLVAGTLDIGAASLITMASPVRILQFVAGGLFGRDALQGGVPMAAVGMLLQWAMSLLIAAVFVLAWPRRTLTGRRWIASGLAYGAIVFAVMNYAVVPMSAWRRVPTFTPLSFAENMLAMLVFGLIVAYAARRLGTAR